MIIKQQNYNRENLGNLQSTRPPSISRSRPVNRSPTPHSPVLKGATRKFRHKQMMTPEMKKFDSNRRSKSPLTGKEHGDSTMTSTTSTSSSHVSLFMSISSLVNCLIIIGLLMMAITATLILGNDELEKAKELQKRFKQSALKVPPCDAGYFQCDSGDFCVKQQFNCDDTEDCPDGSDESNCTDKDDSSYYNKLFSKRPDEDREKLTVNCSLSFVPPTCTCSGRGIFCVNQDLQQIPPKLPSKMTVLDLSGNRISTILNASFTRRFRQLKSLIMTSNNIRSMEPEAFHNLTELTHLHLIGNQLEIIQDHMFKKNKKLLLLNLSYNLIKMIGAHAFDGLNELIELDLRACQLVELPAKIFSTLQNLELLWLQRNRIASIYPNALINLHKLDTLSLAHNQLKKLNEEIFKDLTHLKSLSLAYNQINEITDNQLNAMTSLTKLDLSFNQIETIGPNVFANMHQLRSLALQGNHFKKLPQPIFNELNELTHIYFSNFRMCTYALKVRVCTPRGDGISSVQHLLDNVILRVAVWIVAFIAMIGNCLVIIGRMMMHELNVVHSFFIKNLAMADLLMGIYLLIIAYYDIKFRNHYILHEEEWRYSWQCTFAGVISTISSEASVFILAIITIDRYLSVMHPFSIKRHSMTFAVLAMFIVWTMSIILALMPVIAKSYFVNRFYSNNGVCLGLEIHDGSPLGYSTFLFCGLNSTAFMLILYAYVKMSMAIMNSAIGLRTTQQQQDRNIAKRCAFIVATDGICWLPIVLIKLAAISGIPINQDLYAWVAVFLLPVNSALNPVLYTLTTKLFKQQLNRIITHNFSTSIVHRRSDTCDSGRGVTGTGMGGSQCGTSVGEGSCRFGRNMPIQPDNHSDSSFCSLNLNTINNNENKNSNAVFVAKKSSIHNYIENQSNDDNITAIQSTLATIKATNKNVDNKANNNGMTNKSTRRMTTGQMNTSCPSFSGHCVNNVTIDGQMRKTMLTQINAINNNKYNHIELIDASSNATF